MKRSAIPVPVLLLVVFLNNSFPAFSQTIWYVDADAAGAQTGASWADAFADLQSALAQAQSGDQIWVAEGVYRPDSVDRLVSFELKSGVQLYGGFGGWESSLSERDWEAHPTVLSGEIGDPADSTDNSCHVLFMRDVDSTTVIDGFVVRDGHANCGNYPGYTGGGMLMDGQDGGYIYARIRNCIIEDNYALSGGGVMVTGRNYGSVAPRFYNCTFRNNRAASRAGGLYRTGGSFEETVNDLWECRFIDNYAYHQGGALYYEEGPGIDRFEIVDCVFENNWTTQGAGSTMMWFGTRADGSSSLLLDSCYIEANGTGSSQGSVVRLSPGFDGVWGRIDIKDCTIFSQDKGSVFVLDNGFWEIIEEESLCSFTGNIVHFVDELGFFTSLYVDFKDCFIFKDALPTQYFQGVASIQAYYTQFSDCYFQLNYDYTLAEEAEYVFFDVISGGFLFETDSPSILIDENSIFLSNEIGTSQFIDNDFIEKCFHVNDQQDSLSIIISNCLFFKDPERHLLGIQHESSDLYNINIYNSLIPSFAPDESLPYHLTHCYVGDTTGVSEVLEWGPGNIVGGEAGFVDSAGGDFHLLPCSPLRDAGYTDVVQQLGLVTDLDGEARVQGAAVDIGPYEHAALRLELDSVWGVASCAAQPVPVQVRVLNGCPPWWVWPAGTQDTVWSDSEALLSLSLGGGSHALVVQDSRGEVDTLWVEVPVEPVSLSLAAAPVECPGAGGSVSVTGASGATAPLSYAWSTGDTSWQVTGLAAGTYAVTVTDAWGCTAVDSAVVEVEGALPLALSTQPVSCYGAQDGELSVTGLDAVWPQTWQWSDGSTDSLRTGLGAGGYGVTVTDALGCAGSLTAVLTEPDSLVAWITGDSLLCAGGEVELRAVGMGGTPAYVASWSTGQAGPTLAVTQAGDYAVTLTDAHGCAATASVTVEAVTAPVVEWQVDSATSEQSADGRIELTVSGSWGPYEVQWSTGATGLVLDSVAAGTYEVTLTDAGGCTYAYAIEVPAGMVTGTEAVGAASPRLHIRPNPSGREGAWLEVRGLSGRYAVRVYDAQGRRLWEASAEGERVRLPRLPQGAYRVEVQSDAARGVVSWVVVE